MDPDVKVSFFRIRWLCLSVHSRGVGILAEKDKTLYSADKMTLHVLRDLPVRNKANFSRLCLGRPLVST
jgi:hypothetical protein